MGFGDYNIQQGNGRKEKLGDIKHGVRKEQLDSKYQALFDAYDANKDGTLEAEELDNIFKGLQNFAGSDNVLDTNENAQVKSIFAEQVNIQDVDFQGFVKSVSDASADIIETKEKQTSDGGKEVTTTYNDGTTETIAYYPDGDYKFKKTIRKVLRTEYFAQNKKLMGLSTTGEKISKKEFDELVQLQKQYQNSKSIEELPTKLRNKVKKALNSNLTMTRTTQDDKPELELSERAKQDVAVRDFVLSHYIETHKAAKEALESMGMLDNAGALINTGAGECWNAIKNKWNGTEEEYQNFYELREKFEPNYNKALRESSNLKFMRNYPENYFRRFANEMPNYTLEKGATFQAKTEQYQNAQILKERLNLLKIAMDEVEQYDIEKNSNLLMPGDVNTASSHITKTNELLLQYFGGDQNAVDMILNGALGDENAKVVQAIKDIYTETQKMNESVLGGKSFDEIQDEYKTQYKEMYNTDFVPDDLTEKVMDAKATGSMVKLAAITIISVLITRSPIMAEINAGIAGGAEATGAAANLVKTLVAKYGQTAVQQGIKFAMTSGTLATDVGLTLLNQVTSERGVNGEELWESTKSSAKFIYFGAYVGGPLAQAVSKQLGKIGATAKMFESGVKSTNGAVQTTTIAGDKLMQNLAKGGYKVLTKGGAFLTDVAAFTGLEVVTDGADLLAAGKEQLEFLPKLKIMNGIIEYMLGGRVHAGMVKAKMDAAIEQSGVKNWTIKEIKTPTKTMYEVEIAEGMPKAHFANSNDLATAMAEVIAGKYEKLNAAKGETSKPDASTKQKADKTPHPNPLPQEASEQSGVRAIDAKYLQKVNDEITKLVDKYKDDFYWLKAKDITENFDYTNADRHLRNLDILLKNNSNRLSGIMKLGYFSSKDGANALEWIIQNYSFKSSGNRVSEADHIASALTPTEVLRAINRNITDNENIIGLAQLNDIEYDRWQTSPYKGKLMFVSSNDNVNKFFLSLDKKYVEYLKTIDKYILEDIAKAPKDEKDILNFYEHLLNSLNNDTWEFCEVLKGENLPAYKKAYEYLKEHNIGNAKIALVDSSKDNIYSNENIYNMFKGKTADDWNIVFFDEQGNFIRADVANKIESHKTENIKTDTRNIEFQTETKKNAKSKRDILINSVKKIRDNNGKLLYTERYEASYDIANKFNIIREYPDGKKYKIGLAEVSNAGDIIIEKSLVSEIGVKTDYNYLETPNGSILSNTRITDKNGNVIFNNNYQYKVIDNNHYSTVENGVKYDIQFKKDKVTVTRDDGKSVSISLGNNSVGLFNAVLSKNLLPILKNMPGSFYFDIKEYKLKKIGLDINDVEENNAHYDNTKKLIAISKGDSDSNFILAHEFGHYRDEFLKVSSDPDVINTYMKERKALIENQSQFEAIQLDYFINAYTRRTESIEGSIQEITAEINAFLYASNMKPDIELRGQYLQQYFPETFAIITKKLTNH